MELSILILFVGDSFEILEVTIDLRDREIEMFPTSILQICSPADCPAPSNAIVVSVMIANTDQHSFYRQQYLDKTQPTTGTVSQDNVIISRLSGVRVSKKHKK